MIKKRNLDPSLIQWIMQQTGLGPGIGELFWVAPAASATSQFRTQLQRWGVEQNYKIYTAPATAHAAMVANRNDVMLIMPGKYTGTTSSPFTWSKDYTHMLGLGPPQRHEYAGRGVVVRTLDGLAAYALLNTGDLCQFHNIAFQQWGEAAGSLTAFREQGHMNTFKGCHFFGQIRSDTIALTTSSSLEIDGAGAGKAGSADTFIECVVGGSGGAKRTAINGTLYFTNGGIGAGVDIQFKDCQFMSWMEDVDPCAVLFGGGTSMDRLALFEGCTFYNFVEDHGATKPAYAIRVLGPTGQITMDVLLKRCARLGFTAWTNTQTFIFSADAKGAQDGGEGIAADLT